MYISEIQSADTYPSCPEVCLMECGASLKAFVLARVQAASQLAIFKILYGY